MSFTGFLKENMIGVKEDISQREDYYKGLIENFIYNVYGYTNYDRQGEIIKEYYDKNCPFDIKIDGKKIENEDEDVFSWFTLDIADYMHYGDQKTDNANEILTRLLDEWTDEFVGDLDGIITEEEYDKWLDYYYDLNEEDHEDE